MRIGSYYYVVNQVTRPKLHKGPTIIVGDLFRLVKIDFIKPDFVKYHCRAISTTEFSDHQAVIFAEQFFTNNLKETWY